MDSREFETRLNKNPRPVMVEFWASWCVPCRAMEPALKQISQTYAGQVDVWKINADESPEVLRSLGIMGIPTVVGFVQGKEILRRTGRLSASALDGLFDAALHPRQPAILPPAPVDRLVRTGAGLALLALGWVNGPSLVMLGIGAVVLFSAVYDRCPVYRAIAPRVVSFFRRANKV